MSKKERHTISIPVRSTKKTRSGSGFSATDTKTVAQRRALVKEFENSIKPMAPYKPARLYDAKGDLNKGWYVEYWYLFPGQSTQYKRFKEKLNINRKKTYKERYAYGQDLVKFFNRKLEAGYNPFTSVKVQANAVEIKILAQLFILKTELSNGAPSNYAVASFTENYNRIIDYIKHRNIEGIVMAQFDMSEAKKFRRYLIEQKKASKTINSSFSYLSRFWDLAIEHQYTDQNPFKSIPRVKKREAKRSEKAERFEPLTSEEMDVVFPKLKELNQDNFIRFLAMIYYAWARPVEITRLKVQDIELKRELIRFKDGETKNSEASYVQIVPPLLKLLKQIDFSKYPGHYYLFSHGFVPGTTQVSKHYALAHWRRLIKVKTGIEKDMYALKHTGNIEYLLKNKGNIDLKWQQMQNRHKSSVMTDRYNRKLGVYFIEVGDLNYRHFEDQP